MRKIIAILLSVLLLCSLLAGCGGPANDESTPPAPILDSTPDQPEPPQDDTITVTDFDGLEVTFPKNPQRIGALLGNSFPQILFLGGADRVAITMQLGYSDWFYEIYSEVEGLNITNTDSARDPNVEELAQLDIDLVFYWCGMTEQVENMNRVGIPVVASNPSGIVFNTSDEYLDLLEAEMMLYAVALGDDAQQKAEKWLTYMREKVDYVSSRVETLSPEEIKDVYYIRSAEDGLQCFAQSSYPLMLVRIAGGELVSRDLDTNLSGFTDVTMEQVVEWDPDVIFMGWMNNMDPVMNDSRWSTISAVKNGQVFLTPTSTNSTFWDYGPEAPLDLLYIAKTLHPELFEDLDIIKEIQDFYKTFCDYDLSAEGAQRMLDRLPPV